MGLIQYTQIEDNTDASANSLNSRFAILFDEINGNLDSANLKNNSITTAKIAPGAVTSDKLSVSKYIDDNGWTVTDYGSTKTYKYERSGTLNIGANTGFEMYRIPLPVGLSSLDDVYFNWSARQYSQEVIYTVWPDPNVKNKIVMRAWSTVGVPINGHTYTFTYSIEPKALN